MNYKSFISKQFNPPLFNVEAAFINQQPIDFYKNRYHSSILYQFNITLMLKFIFTLTFLFFSLFLFAQNTSSIIGRIVDSGNEPVPAINISLSGVGNGAITNEDGIFSLRNITAGVYTLEATGIGFTAVKQNVQVTAGKTLDLSLQLDRASNQLLYGSINEIKCSEPIVDTMYETISVFIVGTITHQDSKQ